MELISALILGLLGSAHCAGMCGPIALALPLVNQSWWTRITSGLTYNTGRVLTYALLGFLFGLLGKGIYLGGLQQWASIGIGVIMILSVIFPFIFRKINLESSTYKMISLTKSLFGRLFAKRSYYSLFVIGLLNGILPCGLVYIALAGAIVSGEARDGLLYMTVFGVGTIPSMLAISVLGNVISVRFRNKIRRIIPFFIILIGILFILRGMNLGIKYISPKIDKREPTKMECCH